MEGCNLMKYWQISAGDKSRNYSDAFLRYGVMLVGPGDQGHYFHNGNKKYYNQTGLKKIGIPTFAEDVQEGDIVTLRRQIGKNYWEVIAAGFVKSDYKHLEVFDDVQGWPLQHCRYVGWKKPIKLIQLSGFARGTFRQIRDRTIQRRIKKIVDNGISVKQKRIPDASPVLEDEDLLDFLIDYGLGIKDAEEFTKTIRRIRYLTRWYFKKGSDISEHETRTFLIIPLILTIGWTEQQLKIEWNHVDIAFFSTPYTEDSNDPSQCVMILESKRLREGLMYAKDQAKTYANQFTNCNRFVISDGCRYRLYEREEKNWHYSAYLNVLRPKQGHPYEPNVGGAQDIFLKLMKK